MQTSARLNRHRASVSIRQAPVCLCVPGCGLICRGGWEHTEVSQLPHVQAYLTEKDKHVGMYAQGIRPRRAGSCSCMMLT